MDRRGPSLNALAGRAMPDRSQLGGPALTLVAEQSRVELPDSHVSTFLYVAAGARDLPTFASLITELGNRSVRNTVLHAGERSYAVHLEDAADLLPADSASMTLGAAAGSRGARTAHMLSACDLLLETERPTLVVVSGASDASFACAVAAAKRGIPVASVGAGLRSSDWSSPDEINRVLVDRLADTLLTADLEAGQTLQAEGVPETRTYVVGSTLVDPLRRWGRRARARAAWERFGATPGRYVLASFHGSAIFEDGTRRRALARALVDLGANVPLVVALETDMPAGGAAAGLRDALAAAGVPFVIAPSYLDALSLEAGAGAIVTDSGPVQDEATALGIACFTLDRASERAVSLTQGTNTLVGDQPADLAAVRPGAWTPATPCAVPLWDGRAGERAAEALAVNYTLQCAPVVLPG